MLDSRPPRRLIRVLGALIIGAAFAIRPYTTAVHPPDFAAGDLTPLRLAAHALERGQNPYREQLVVPSDPRFDGRLLYPLPAVLVVAPLAELPPVLLRSIWGGLAAALVTYLMLSRIGVHTLAIVTSKCAERAFSLAQWSPYFFASVFVAPLQVLAIAKPTIALFAWVYRPSWWPFIGGLVLGAVSLALLPSWPTDWLRQTAAVSYYAPAIVIWKGGGPLLLLALLRWRRPEARLLAAMALVPHNYIYYDQLLLFLVPRKPAEYWLLSLLSWVAFFVASYFFWKAGIPEPAGQVAFRAPIVALMYLPALAMVLARPNEAELPELTRKLLTRLSNRRTSAVPRTAD